MEVTSASHVVDWQFVGDAVAAHSDPETQGVREQIKSLEARAMVLLQATVTHPGAAAAQRSLARLELQIARLRSELAWLRAATRGP